MTDKVLIHHVNHPVADVYPYFSDIHKFISIHPVIYKCDMLAEHSYLLYERLKIAGLGISFSYKVEIESLVPDQQVVMFSEIRKGATLKLVFDFSGSNGKTMLTETVTFNGPAIIKPFFVPFLAKTHMRMIRNLNDLK